MPTHWQVSKDKNRVFTVLPSESGEIPVSERPKPVHTTAQHASDVVRAVGMEGCERDTTDGREV